MADEAMNLGRRERQIVEALYKLGEGSVAQVRAALPDPPSYSAVRAMLNMLAEKQIVTFRQDGKRYVYRPTKPKDKVRRSALRNLVQTFFAGQPADAVAALLEGSAGKLPAEQLERLKQLISEAERVGR